MITTTKAIVLNQKKYGDTSLICNLFSYDYGKIAIIAKSARTIKNPLGAILQPLNYIECVYYFKKSRNIQTIKEASMIHKYYNLENNYNKMNRAYVIIDIINHINYAESPSKIIFRLVKKTLENMDESNEKLIDILFVFFQIQCLIYLGYHPNVISCVRCGVKLHDAKFDFSLGQLSCNRCCKEKTDLDVECFNIMRFLIKTHIDDIDNKFNYQFNRINKINKYLYQYILYHIPEVRYSKAFINQQKYD